MKGLSRVLQCNRVSAWLLGFVLYGTVALGWGGYSAAAEADGPKPLPPEQQVLHFNNGTEPETIDPHKATGVPEHKILVGLLEGLTVPDPRTLEPLPGAAESWVVSDDGLTYTFKLRADGKWSDGTPVTAADFEYAWMRCLSPETASQYSYMLWYLKGAKAYNTGQNADPDSVGVEALDELTLRVQLENPAAFFLSLQFHYTYFPVPRQAIRKHGDKWTRAEYFVGNGAYRLKEWRPREHLTLVPNPHYWDRDPSHCRLQKIVIHPIDKQETAYRKYLAGELDWLSAVPATLIDEVKRDPDFGVSAYLGSYYYRLNTTREPLNDERVRKALLLAIDRRDVCVNVTKAGEIPSRGYVPPGIPGYEGVDVLRYDPDRARALLAEAGFPNGEGFPELKLLFNTSESHKKLAEVIVRMWRESLGIKVVLENTEWKVYLDRTDRLDFDICRAGWIGDYLDPMTFLDMFVTDGGNNNTGWSNEEYDRLVDQVQAESDPVKRGAMMLRLETILVSGGAPIVPVYYYVNKWLRAPYVQGVWPNILDSHPWKYIWISEDEED